MQAWALNRYYYQAMIPIKDASLIARCEDSAIRREWRSRLVDHDGEREGDGGIARWLKLTDGLGLDREYVTSLRGLLPATRFAVDAYVRFVREKTLLEAIASSLTELFSPQIIGERVEGMLAQLRSSPARRSPISTSGRRRPRGIPISRSIMSSAMPARPRSSSAVLAALEFKCGVLWAMLDALHHAYVDPKQVPQGAFVPEGDRWTARRQGFLATRARGCRAGCDSRRASEGRLGSARPGTRVQGRQHHRRNSQALHRGVDIG